MRPASCVLCYCIVVVVVVAVVVAAAAAVVRGRRVVVVQVAFGVSQTGSLSFVHPIDRSFVRIMRVLCVCVCVCVRLVFSFLLFLMCVVFCGVLLASLDEYG